MSKVIVILGPTAVGKSKTSIEVAKALNGEIISADSMQIYKELNIGTGKITEDEMQNIPHHLLNIKAFHESYTVKEYVDLVNQKIEEISSRSKVPILVGGTGLYIKALIEGYSFYESDKNLEFRINLNNLAEEKGNEEIYTLLKNKNLEIAKKIKISDRKRIIRALEILENGNINAANKKNKNEFMIFALNMKRELLYDKINNRVDQMIESGLINEVKGLYNTSQNKDYQSLKGIGYKELFPYFDGKIALNEAIEQIKQNSRRYAKRQLTWLRGMHDVVWIDVLDENASSVIIKAYNGE